MKKNLVILFFLLAAASLFAEKTALQKRNDLISTAKEYLGTPYSYGGTSRRGIDCSGFVYVAVRDSGNGVIPRTAAEIYKFSKKINFNECQPGDLLFFAASSKITHVGIFLGNGQFIHSASDGPKTGVIISRLSENYWSKHFYACGRIIGEVKNIAKAEESVPEKKETEHTESTNDENTYEQNENSNFFDKNFCVSAVASVNYTFLGSENDRIAFSKEASRIKGITLGAELTAKTLRMPVSLFVRATYENDDSVLFMSRITVPAGIKLNFNKYFSAYTGIVFNNERYSLSKPLLHGTDIQITTPLFPGYFGIEAETPKLKLGKIKLSLAENLSYTHHTAVQGYQKLSFAQSIASGLSLSTFLRAQWN